MNALVKLALAIQRNTSASISSSYRRVHQSSSIVRRKQQIVCRSSRSSSSSSDNDSNRNSNNSSSSNSNNEAQAIYVTKLGATANIGLAICKGVAGYFANSTGLMADAVSSLTDLVSDSVVYFSIIEARKGKSSANPWGRGKVEPLGALTIGSLLLVTGVGIGYESYKALLCVIDLDTLLSSSSLLAAAATTSAETTTSAVAATAVDVVPIDNNIYAAALSVSGLGILCKEMLFRVSLKAGLNANSSVVIANAYQHRSDVGTSSAVFIGLLGTAMGYPLLDPLAGLLVGGVIIKQGVSTVVEAIRDLTDSPAELEETEGLCKICLEIPGIITVEELFARRSGPYLFVDCKVGVNGNISASAAHCLAELVRKQLLSKCAGRVANVIVHVGPLGSQGLGELSPDWARNHNDLVHEIKSLLLRIKAIQDVSDVQIYYRDNGKIAVKIDVYMNDFLSIKEANRQSMLAKKLILQKMPFLVEVDIDLELNNECTDDDGDCDDGNVDGENDNNDKFIKRY